MHDQDLNPWPNGLAKSHKFLLASEFGQALRALAFTCYDLRSLWSRSNFLLFGQPNQVNAS